MSSSWKITADKFLGQDQIARLLVHLRDQRDLAIARRKNTQAIKDYYVVRGLLETGLRVFEFCALKNTDLQGHRLVVHNGKGGKARTVLLTKATGNLFKEWLTVKEQLGFSLLPQDPLFPSRYRRRYTTRGIQSRIEIIFAGLGFPEGLSTHSLRHTYCSLLLESKKVSLAMAKENMGHSSIATTNLYAHAIGNLDDVDLFETSTSPSSHKCEPQSAARSKNANNLIKAFVGNTNSNAAQPTKVVKTNKF